MKYPLQGLERYRQEYLAEISAGLTPLGELPAANILHLIPYSAASEEAPKKELSPLARFRNDFGQFSWPFWSDDTIQSHCFFDFRGFGCELVSRIPDSLPFGYSRILRNGAIEQVDVFMFRDTPRTETPRLLDHLARAADRQLQLAHSIGEEGPFELYFTMWNVSGKSVDRRQLDRENFLFPGIRVNSRETARDDMTALRYHIAQAFGHSEPQEFSSTPTYDDDIPTPWAKYFQG